MLTHQQKLHRDLAMKALIQMRGDDGARAIIAFRNMTPEQMQEQHGQSGQTRAEVLNGYKERDRKVDAALEWLRSL